jgi:uncharacterized protein DUF4291
MRAGRFVEPFNRHLMTWIKPSFLWMMYPGGRASKPGQERVLAIEITRVGFEWALAHSCLSSYMPGQHTDQARVRPWRATSTSGRCPLRTSRRPLTASAPWSRPRDYQAAEAHLPAEALYPLPSGIAAAIGATG